MSKKNVKQIGSYYKKKDVVDTYDDRRFSGLGGKYINLNELSPILTFLKNKKNNEIKILDIGAGRGRLSKPMLSKGFNVYCLDFSEEMVEELSKTFDKNKLTQQSIFDVINFKENFDLITSLRFFDHFAKEDQVKILRNLENKLNNGGQIIVPTLNKNSLESLVSKLFPYGRYNYFYSLNEYKEIFDQAGLKIKSYNSKFFFPRGIFLKLNDTGILLTLIMQLDSFLSRLFRDFNAYYFFILKRK
jgi:ubiquinone/menaquinone biosynthesis C-methylase UbiE